MLGRQPQSQNRFAYAEGNPVQYADPTGMCVNAGAKRALAAKANPFRPGSRGYKALEATRQHYLSSAACGGALEDSSVGGTPGSGFGGGRGYHDVGCLDGELLALADDGIMDGGALCGGLVAGGACYFLCDDVAQAIKAVVDVFDDGLGTVVKLFSKDSKSGLRPLKKELEPYAHDFKAHMPSPGSWDIKVDKKTGELVLVGKRAFKGKMERTGEYEKDLPRDYKKRK
jgi:hypothetical protein